MNGFSKAYERVILGHPVVVLIVLGAVLAFFSYHAKDFKLDASSDSLLLENDKDLKIFRESITRYHIKDFLERVDSVVTLLDIPLLGAPGVELSKMTEETVKSLEDPGVDIQEAKKEILQSPIYKDLILSSDGQTTGLIIYLKEDTHFSELSKKRNQLLEKKSSAVRLSMLN